MNKKRLASKSSPNSPIAAGPTEAAGTAGATVAAGSTGTSGAAGSASGSRPIRTASSLVLLLFPLALLSCSEPPTEESLEAAINHYLEQNEFEDAFALLDAADANSAGANATDADAANADVSDANAADAISDSGADTGNVKQLRIRVHLAYANYLTHEADHLGMAARMSDALKHYRRVVQLDPDNSQALTHIELIEGIYEQMGRDIPEGIAE